VSGGITQLASRRSELRLASSAGALAPAPSRHPRARDGGVRDGRCLGSRGYTDIRGPAYGLGQPTERCSPPGLRIAVLGPLVVDGAAGFLQPRQAELVVALAFAGPAGRTGDSLRGMLGADPDHPKPPDSLRQIIARTRQRLGTSPGGGDYIVHDGGARYFLDPAASLDWHEFLSLARRGQAARDPRLLQDALALLRGQPLDGLDYWWLDTTLIESIRSEIATASGLLAELALEAGDPVTARRAILSGMAAEPSAERLWRLLMIAEAAAGNAAGVHRTWLGCLAAIADITPGGEPHADTTAVYLELTGRCTVPASVSRPRQRAAALEVLTVVQRRRLGRAAG